MRKYVCGCVAHLYFPKVSACFLAVLSSLNIKTYDLILGTIFHRILPYSSFFISNCQVTKKQRITKWNKFTIFMHEKLKLPLSCHTFNVHRIYYSRFSNFSYKFLPILEFLFKISGWLKTLLKHIMTKNYIYGWENDFSFSEFLFHMVMEKHFQRTRS